MNKEEFKFTPIDGVVYGKLNPDCIYPKFIFNNNEPNIHELFEKLQRENQQLREKYLNAVADYETTKSENQQLHNKLKKGSELIKIKTKIIPLEDGGGLELCDYDILNLLEILKDSDVDE